MVQQRQPIQPMPQPAQPIQPPAQQRPGEGDHAQELQQAQHVEEQWVAAPQSIDSEQFVEGYNTEGGE